MRYCYFASICLALLASCSEKSADVASDIRSESETQAAPQNKFGFMEAVRPGPDLFGRTASSTRYMAFSPVSAASDAPAPSVGQADAAEQAQIAYTYSFAFRISTDKIASLQKTHIALCDSLGPKCRVLHTSLSSSDQDGAGEIKLQVAASVAPSMEKALSEPATKIGGDLVSSQRDGEDLSKSIVDSEAKLQSRLVLRGKLTDILRNNKGSVDELIKAEKAVADVNEEIDATASELQGYRSRVRFSDVTIDYQPTYGETQLGFARPIATAARSIGTTLGIAIAALIYFVTALAPIVLFVLALRWVLHRSGLRIRFWRKTHKTAADVS